jgi:D-sedoheptulose 7-phosphate isomerase
MNWDQIAEQALAVTHQVLTGMRQPIDELAVELARRIEAGGKILICGNGGSAGDAQHFAGELVNRFLFDRRPYAGIALTTDTSVLTAIGNDFGYDQVFSKQVEALGTANDALVAISTSGNAANVLNAVAAAKEKGMLTIAMTGGQGGKLAGAVDTLLSVSCTSSTPRIQEGHGLIIHLLCERIEEILR